MVCDFCGGKCGVRLTDTLDYVCDDCIEAANAAAWDEINSEFDRLQAKDLVTVTVDEPPDTLPPW